MFSRYSERSIIQWIHEHDKNCVLPWSLFSLAQELWHRCHNISEKHWNVFTQRPSTSTFLFQMNKYLRISVRKPFSCTTRSCMIAVWTYSKLKRCVTKRRILKSRVTKLRIGIRRILKRRLIPKRRITKRRFKRRRFSKEEQLHERNRDPLLV